ncbi:MAG TPA: hypothetical protein VJW17_12815 [Pyrinomonadaceae bacterium]|nr:hypothetical protein [Pyrinomonadaceae bacterium]
MKAYLLTTGVIFALLVLMHVLRLILESTRFLSDPFFIGLTLLSASMAVWSFVLFRRLSH